MMKRIYLLAVLLAVACSASAVVATPYPVTKRLADGSEVQVYIRGDEHYHYLTDLQGRRIAGSDVGVPPAMQAQTAVRIPERMMLSSTVPSSGTVHIPVILVNFSDLGFTLSDPREQVSQLFNTTGGSNPQATGSVHTYYEASSYGALDLQFDVYGPYTLDNPMAYYGANSSSSHNIRVSALIVEAAELAREAGVDFSPYDNDGDGTIDNLSVVVAGYNEAEGGPEGSIWPHYSHVSTAKRFSGKSLYNYLIISEYRGYESRYITPAQAGIGTYCHEFGHALGLPDLYNTDSSSAYTVGNWTVMCSGCYNNNGSTPPSFTAFERFMMGWMQPVQLERANNYVLEPVETSNTAYLLADKMHNLTPESPSPAEYFLIENRQPVGWDANTDALVGEGLLVSHITFSSYGWNANTFNNSIPLGYAVVSAGIASPSRSTPADLFPGTNGITTWIPVLNNGTRLVEQMIMNIRQLADDNVLFHYGANAEDGFFFTPNVVDDLTTTYDGSPVEYRTQEVMLSVHNVNADTLLLNTSSAYFEFSLDSGATWVQDGAVCRLKIYTDTAYSIPLQVRFQPSRRQCTNQTGYLVAESSDGEFVNQLPLRGKSPRPVYITTPVITHIDNVTNTSFRINWEEQEDAEFYYITAYTVSPEVSVILQKFEDFSSVENITAAGWQANFVRQERQGSETGYGVMFGNTGEYMLSEEYITPPSKIRFLVSMAAAYNTVPGENLAGGILVLEASPDGSSWLVLDSIPAIKDTQNSSVKDDVEKIYNTDGLYNRFRLTYIHLYGKNGPVLDGFTATMEQTVNYVKQGNYVCQGTGYEMPATSPCAILSGLEEGTTYYVAVQACEQKGCEANYSPLSAVSAARTSGGEEKDTYLTIRYDAASAAFVAILTEPTAEAATLLIYNFAGQLLSSCAVSAGVSEFVLPTDNLKQGEWYVVKLSTGKLRRKAAKGEFFNAPFKDNFWGFALPRKGS